VCLFKEGGGKKKDFYCARIRFFFVVTDFFFFETWRESEDMQSEEREDRSAPGCGGAAGKKLAQEHTDIAAGKEKLCEDLRQLGRQHAVIVYCFGNG